ncbi:MAG: hypothetical protein LBP58_07775 [Azoarcus sp.]|jgi:hypothetical protein|nr:hypothetical protein [Azoarcus sp.]
MPFICRSTSHVLFIDSSLTDYLTLKGDWANMPVGGKIGFTAGIQHRPDPDKHLRSYREALTEECDIAESLPASRLHPELKGNYKKLRCMRKKTIEFNRQYGQKEYKQYESTLVRYFLEQYGFAVLETESEFLGISGAR